MREPADSLSLFYCDLKYGRKIAALHDEGFA